MTKPTSTSRAWLSREMMTPLALVLGFLLGLILNVLATDAQTGRLYWVGEALVQVAETIGKLFLRMMFMVVLPMVVSALALAVADLGDVRSLGRVGLRTLFFTAIFSFSAVVIGVTLVNVLGPGRHFPEAQRERILQSTATNTKAIADNASKAKSLKDTVVDMLPENPLQELVGAIDGTSKGNGMLAVMVFSLILGVAVTSRRAETATLVDWLRGLQAVSISVIEFAVSWTPLGAGCLVFAVASRLGLSVIWPLLLFVVVTVLGLAIQLFGTYSLALAMSGRHSPAAFFRGAWPALTMAFGTSSSNATLPTSLRIAETGLGLPPRISNFVLTIGATGNQNGTALFEGVVILFLAQVMGVDLSLQQQIAVVIMAVLAGVGTAGIPGGSLPLIVVVMKSVGVPEASIGLVLGVDRILDMCRTTVNVGGDLVVASCVAAGEKTELPPAVTPSPPPEPSPPQDHA